jgi:hypothetical protein
MRQNIHTHLDLVHKLEVLERVRAPQKEAKQHGADRFGQHGGERLVRRGQRNGGARRTAQRQRGVGEAIARAARLPLALWLKLVSLVAVLAVLKVVQVGVAEQIGETQTERLDRGRGD